MLVNVLQRAANCPEYELGVSALGVQLTLARSFRKTDFLPARRTGPFAIPHNRTPTQTPNPCLARLHKRHGPERPQPSAHENDRWGRQAAAHLVRGLSIPCQRLSKANN